LSEPTYHHYVSKFYLNKFASQAGKNTMKTNVFDKSTKQIFRNKKTEKVGGIAHFNRSFSKDDPNDVEKFYARKIETPAGAALNRILDEKAFTSEQDLQDVLLFFAMTTARNPKARNQIEGPMRAIDELLVRSALGDEAADVLEKRLNRDLFPQEHVAMERSLIDPIFASLATKDWAILETTSKASEFITCDDPLQIIGADEARPWGFESNGAIIYAPLCPTLAILGKNGKLKSTKVTMNLEQVAGLNSATFRSAYRLIFYKSDKFSVLGEKDTSIVRWADLAKKYR